MYSETANNHGRLIAFLLPLSPLVFLVMYLIFGVSRVLVYPFFIIFGKRKKYNAFVELVKSPELWGYKRLTDQNLQEAQSFIDEKKIAK